MLWKHKKAENHHKSFLSKSRCISDTNKSNDQCLNFPSSCPRGAYEIQSRKHQESLPIDSHRTRLAPTPRAAGAQESDGNAQYATPQSCLPGIQGSPLRRAGHGSQTACLPCSSRGSRRPGFGCGTNDQTPGIMPGTAPSLGSASNAHGASCSGNKVTATSRGGYRQVLSVRQLPRD